MRTDESHLSAITIDALAIRALSEIEQQRALVHLQRCERCREEAESARLAREHFAERVLPRTRDAVRARARGGFLERLRWWHGLAPALATAAAVLLFVTSRPTPQAEPELAVKGGPTLQLFARRTGRVFQVDRSTVLAAGDELRFVLNGGGLPYVFIASVDGAGKSNVYYPFHGAASMVIDPTQRVELPGSIVLDDAPGPERVFALFSKQPLQAERVLQALAKAGASDQKLAIAADAQLVVRLEKTRR